MPDKFSMKQLWLFAALLLISCSQDAPRDNPFDPDNALYHYAGDLTGTITSRYIPYAPMDSVSVTLFPDLLLSYTDAAGIFGFRDLAPGEYRIQLEKHGYQSVIDTIMITEGKRQTVLYRMNGQPQIDSVTLVTRHIAHWWPIEHEYILWVSVLAGDGDGVEDIDSVFLSLPDENFMRGLAPAGEAGTFEITLFDSDFLPLLFAELPGKAIQFTARDRNAAVSEAYTTQISRIITLTPETLSPGSQEVITSRPLFRWSSIEVGYTISYYIAVFRLNESGIPQFVLGSDVLDNATLEWQPDTDLAPALYYWTVTVTDRFGNTSSSKEATFIVQ